MLHGHWATALVVKLHEYGLLIGVPEAFCAPDTVAVYVVLPASGLFGVNVATVSAALKLTDPATAFPAEFFTVNDTVLGVTACENVADGATDAALPVNPAAGVTVVTDGGVAARRRRVHHVNPVVVVVPHVGGEGVGRAVGVDPAAGQRGQRPVGHRRGQPLRWSPPDTRCW